MSKDSGERKSEDQYKKGKGILMYQRKKSRKDGQNKKAAALPSKQQAPPPESPVMDWANANSGHLLTCACRVCTGGVPTPLFRSNIIASPQLADDGPRHNLPMPVFQFSRFKPHRPEQDCPAGGFVPPVFARFRTKVSKAKVYPSVVIPPSNEHQKTRREISLPKMEDISFIELLASGDERASSLPTISFMDMLQNEKLKGDHQALVPAGNKVAGGCNLRQCFVEESKVQNGLPAAREPKSKINYFMKMVMEEEGGVDDEQLFREVKQELMIREVDAYACLLRKQNLDFGKLMTTK